jgi:hypothetical protein
MEKFSGISKTSHPSSVKGRGRAGGPGQGTVTYRGGHRSHCAEEGAVHGARLRIGASYDTHAWARKTVKGWGRSGPRTCAGGRGNGGRSLTQHPSSAASVAMLNPCGVCSCKQTQHHSARRARGPLLQTYCDTGINKRGRWRLSPFILVDWLLRHDFHPSAHDTLLLAFLRCGARPTPRRYHVIHLAHLSHTYPFTTACQNRAAQQRVRLTRGPSRGTWDGGVPHDCCW